MLIHIFGREDDAGIGPAIMTVGGRGITHKPRPRGRPWKESRHVRLTREGNCPVDHACSDSPARDNPTGLRSNGGARPEMVIRSYVALDLCVCQSHTGKGR